MCRRIRPRASHESPRAPVSGLQPSAAVRLSEAPAARRWSPSVPRVRGGSIQEVVAQRSRGRTFEAAIASMSGPSVDLEPSISAGVRGLRPDLPVRLPFSRRSMLAISQAIERPWLKAAPDRRGGLPAGDRLPPGPAQVGRSPHSPPLRLCSPTSTAADVSRAAPTRWAPDSGAAATGAGRDLRRPELRCLPHRLGPIARLRGHLERRARRRPPGGATRHGPGLAPRPRAAPPPRPHRASRHDPFVDHP